MPRPFQFWTVKQQNFLLAACVILLGFLTIEIWRRSSFRSDPPPLASLRADEIQDRLDPNTADAAELSAIPNLGESRATAIVEYRQKFLEGHPGKRAFESAEDLRHVKGIGPGTENTLEGFLTFTKK